MHRVLYYKISLWDGCRIWDLFECAVKLSLEKGNLQGLQCFTGDQGAAPRVRLEFRKVVCRCRLAQLPSDLGVHIVII